MMKASEIILLGVKGTVIAYERATSRRLWSTPLGKGMDEGFVSVAADEARVYAHTFGKLHCLDLFTGRELWKDTLKGMGYGITSIALPSVPGTAIPPAVGKKLQERIAAAASTAATSS